MQSYQDLISEVIDIIDDEFGIIDSEGIVLACSNPDKIGSVISDTVIETLMQSSDKILIVNKTYYCKVLFAQKINVFAYIRSDTEQAVKLLELFSVNVSNYYQFCLSKFDRASFFRSIIFENLSEQEIFNKAREMRITIEAHRIVFNISVPGVDDNACLSVLKNMFPDRTHNTIFKIDINNYLLVRNVKDNEKSGLGIELANMIKDTVSAELMADTRVAIGTEAYTLPDLKKSYQNAVTANIVGNIFEGKERVADYNKLGIGRLIYKLPEESCRIFLEEIFPNNSYKDFDEEMFKTIEGLLECNFNISKTAEVLFVHRNSVIYRIQKIHKLTGLDVKNFNDAVVFKLAILVSKYLSYIDKQKT